MRKWVFLSALVVLCVVLSSKALGRMTAFVAFLDVGQGDAVLIQLPDDTTILIDAGVDASVREQLGRALPFTDHTIDLAITTHPDADHYTGFSSLLDAYTIGELWISGVEKSGAWGAFLQEVQRRNIPVEEPTQGTTVSFAPGASLTVLWPAADFASDETNDSSIIVRFTYDNQTFLLTGDASVAVEGQLIAGDADISANVLKLGHHGSRTSTSAAFLNAVQPDFAIISAGKDNRYGHPHKEILERLEDAGIPYVRTDSFGTILFSLQKPLMPQSLDKVCLFC